MIQQVAKRITLKWTKLLSDITVYELRSTCDKSLFYPRFITNLEHVCALFARNPCLQRKNCEHGYKYLNNISKWTKTEAKRH